MSNEGGGQEDVEDEDHLNDEDGWFCSEAQALPVVVESLDVFAGHLTTKVSTTPALYRHKQLVRLEIGEEFESAVP